VGFFVGNVFGRRADERMGIYGCSHGCDAGATLHRQQQHWAGTGVGDIWMWVTIRALDHESGSANPLNGHRDGNFDYLTNSVHWQNTNCRYTIPASLYLTASGLLRRQHLAVVDPTGATKLYTLPAKARYDAGTPNVVP